MRPSSLLYIPSLRHLRISDACFLVVCPPLVVDSLSSDCDQLCNGVVKSQGLESGCLGCGLCSAMYWLCDLGLSYKLLYLEDGMHDAVSFREF